jgi:hypothetical protein
LPAVPGGIRCWVHDTMVMRGAVASGLPFHSLVLLTLFVMCWML